MGALDAESGEHKPSLNLSKAAPSKSHDLPEQILAMELEDITDLLGRVKGRFVGAGQRIKGIQGQNGLKEARCRGGETGWTADGPTGGADDERAQAAVSSRTAPCPRPVLYQRSAAASVVAFRGAMSEVWVVGQIDPLPKFDTTHRTSLQHAYFGLTGSSFF